MSILARNVREPSANSPAQVQVLFDGTVAERRIAPGLGQRAAVCPHLVGGEVIDVGEPEADQLDRAEVEDLEVVRSVAQQLPLVAEPVHVGLYRFDELGVFLAGIGVVEAQIAGPGVLRGDAEIQADGFGVAEVQVAVGLGGKTRCHASAMPAGSVVGRHDLANEVVDGGRVGGHGVFQSAPV
jgi:hypothetical protein